MAARNMHDRRCRGGDRSGEGVIELMKYVESELRHGTVSFTDETARFARARKSSIRRGFRRNNGQVTVGVGTLYDSHLARQAGLTRT
jgi:hypothetical protein